MRISQSRVRSLSHQKWRFHHQKHGFNDQKLVIVFLKKDDSTPLNAIQFPSKIENSFFLGWCMAWKLGWLVLISELGWSPQLVKKYHGVGPSWMRFASFCPDELYELNIVEQRLFFAKFDAFCSLFKETWSWHASDDFRRGAHIIPYGGHHPCLWTSEIFLLQSYCLLFCDDPWWML